MNADWKTVGGSVTGNLLAARAKAAEGVMAWGKGSCLIVNRDELLVPLRREAKGDNPQAREQAVRLLAALEQRSTGIPILYIDWTDKGEWFELAFLELLELS